MQPSDKQHRDRLKAAVLKALQPLDGVLAAWECGSVAFDLEDTYSDIDVSVLLDAQCAEDTVYAAVSNGLETVSPVEATHAEPPGRYFKLRDGGDYGLVDVCLYRVPDLPERLDRARHGDIVPLFDKGDWLQPDASNAAQRHQDIAARLQEHRTWFVISQSFVRKAIARGRHVESLAAYWGYTLKPLVELLRMQHCPQRWDFGMRYLERDLPEAAYTRLCGLLFTGKFDDLAECHGAAVAWAEQLIDELERLSEGGAESRQHRDQR
ncbi:MAG: hypothetical protein AAF499_03240 [Pseudomonadota bacterium]